MKKFRLLAVLALAVVMIFTVAAAAEVEYNGTDDTITVNLVAPGTYTIDQASSIFMSYDNAVFSVKSMSSPVYAAATLKDEGNAVSWCCDNSSVAVVEGESVILTVEFNVVDKAAAVGYEFDTESDLTAVFTDAGDYLMDMGSVVVVGAAPAAEAPTYTGTVNPKATLNGIDDVYTGVWAANYTVALNGNDITKVGLRFADKDDNAFAVAKAADGEGSVAFKIAIVGAPADAVATPIVYTTEWIAAEAE